MTGLRRNCHQSARRRRGRRRQPLHVRRPHRRWRAVLGGQLLRTTRNRVRGQRQPRDAPRRARGDAGGGAGAL